MVPIPSATRDELMDCIMSVFKNVLDKLAYCYFNYGVSGLLII